MKRSALFLVFVLALTGCSSSGYTTDATKVIAIPTEEEPPSEPVQEENDMSQDDFTPFYDEGYSSTIDSSPELLYKWGIASAFGATGNPVESKMFKFCRGFVQGWQDSDELNYFDLSEEQKLKAKESWDQGCVAAGMGLRLP